MTKIIGIRARENWYRDLWLVIITGLVALTLALQHTNTEQRHSDQAKINGELKESSTNQIINRAANVETWCGGINGTRDYDRLFVTKVSRGLAFYTLGDIPCEEIIRQTLESPKRKQAITAASNPVTYGIAVEQGLIHVPHR